MCWLDEERGRQKSCLGTMYVLNAGYVGATWPITEWMRDSIKNLLPKSIPFSKAYLEEDSSQERH